MNWDDLRHFSALATSGSLSAAARVLGVEHATVARRVASLEEDLGVRLVDRRGRRWTLTADGEGIAAIADRMNGEARAIARVARGARHDVSGTVTISAPPVLAAAVLTTPLVELRKHHPRLRIRVIGEAREASLDHSEADIAVRLTRPEDGELMISKLGSIVFRLYASPDYLAVTDEQDWCFIGSEGTLAGSPQQAAVEKVAGNRPFCFHASGLEIQRAAAQAGAGIAALPDFMEASDGKLAPIPPGTPLVERGIWLVVHQDLQRSAPIRVVMECLRKVFKTG